MVVDDYRDFGTKILMPLARRMPLGPMGISLVSLITAIAAGYSFYMADLDEKHFVMVCQHPEHGASEKSGQFWIKIRIS